MGPLSRRTTLRRLTVVVVVLALTTVVAEWAVGRFFPVRSRIFELDAELLYTTRPDSRRLLVMGEEAGGERILIEIDSGGFRASGTQPRAGALKVAVYGDSMVLAENVEAPDTFVERLGAHLGANGRAVNVVNAGVTGYGPDQSCLKLERELETLAPDVVVFVLCASNDFGDLMRNKLFRLGEDGELVRERPQPAPRMVTFFGEMEAAAGRPALVRLVENLREQRKRADARRRLDAAGPPPYIKWYLDATRGEYADFVERRDPLVYNLFDDTYDADVAIHPDWPSSRYKRELMGAVLGRLGAVCSAGGVALGVVIVPSAVDVCPSFNIRVDADRWPGYSPRRLTETLAELLDERSIAHLDLFAPIEKEAADELFVGAEDIHWNARGQDLAAAWTAQFLAERGLLP